jgi:hypothetical protein
MKKQIEELFEKLENKQVNKGFAILAIMSIIERYDNFIREIEKVIRNQDELNLTEAVILNQIEEFLNETGKIS